MLSGIYRHIAAAALSIAVLNGCVQEIGNNGSLFGKSSEQICFNSSVNVPTTKAQASYSFGYFSVEEETLSKAVPPTRSAPLTQLDGLEAEVTAYLFDSWVSDIEAWTPLTEKKFIFEEFLLKAEEDPVMWKEAEATAYDKMRVYAVHPYGLEWSVEGDSGEPQITYSTGTDPRANCEVLTAVAEVDREVWRQEIPLTFHHALTGIRFKAGFNCTIESLTLEGICTKGTLHLGPDGWTSSEEKTFSMDFGTGKAFTAGTLLNDGEDIYMMIPQVLGTNAKLILRYDSGKELTANMSGVKWEAGKLITYTLHETVQSSSTVYFDLEAGNISITPSSYSGYVYAGGKVQKVSGAHSDEIEYYVYQSSEAQSSTNKDNTGWETTVGIGECRIPQYERVTFEDHTWSDYITDNKVVEDVIENWDNKAGTSGAVRDVGRDSTIHYIHVGGQLKCKLTVDNIYSRYHDSKGVGRTTGGIGFIPTGSGSTLTINMKGDNRFGCIHYSNRESGSGRQIIFTGTGSMTVADADFYMTKATSNSSVVGDFEYGYYSNHWCAAIGNNDSADYAYGIVFESGVVFAGTTKAENCSAIGGGGNGNTSITIKGGDITAVATTTGTAIGGGIGFNSGGGKGEVLISGGNVYAYNFANRWDIPSSAIGGAGSKAKFGSEGNVTIIGGNVYAQSSIGTAIGGGSSYTMQGGDAIINISGGNVVAKSVAAESGLTPGKTISGGVGIGGGTGCTSGSESNQNGGKATITISGNPIIRTGSIGGGHTNSPGGHLGFATIDISGGDIQAQFIMEPTGSGLADDRPAFVMTGGTIHSSNVNDKEFVHVKSVGGAVYMEDGIFEMSGGHIKDCQALSGGAVYIKGTNTPTFMMSGGKITHCTAETGGGGGVYLEGGKVSISGGEISENLALGGNGGGVCILAGNYEMPEDGSADIYENSTLVSNDKGGNGGGIYVASSESDVTVSILSGDIVNNSADRVGGGICVDMSKATTSKALVTVGVESGSDEVPMVSLNKAIVQGGGLYVSGANADININSGSIIDNVVSRYVDNQDVANEQGMVTLTGGKVTHVVVTFHGKGGYFNSQETAIQNIVTATNSILVQPEGINRTGYTFTGWHTRADGDDSKGKTYSDGDIMNLSSDLSLYAQWEMTQL